MIKKILALVVASSVISAGLLFVGITMMGQFFPALAGPLDPLVAETNEWNSPEALPAEESSPLTVDLAIKGAKPGDSSTAQPVPAIPVNSDPPLHASGSSTSPEPPATEVTIAQLMNHPDQYIGQVVTLTGIATSLDDDEFLLNDGTGQILVDVEDDLVSIATLNGLSIVVTGMLDGSSGQTGFEFEASTLTYPGGTEIIVDDDLDDPDDDDDLNDNDDDDLDDDHDHDDMDDDDNDDHDDNLGHDTDHDNDQDTDHDSDDDIEDKN
jgi:uncharacterized protein YdeI (BOF family)